MSERTQLAPTVMRGLPLLAAGLVMGACGSLAPVPGDIDTASAQDIDSRLVRCYDTPQPLTDYRPQAAESQPKITQSYIDSRKPSEEAITVMRGAAVKISDTKKQTESSGEILQSPDGRLFLGTAAHVVATESLDDLVITDTNGQQARAVGGCYVYEGPDATGEHNSFAALGDESRLIPYDFALIKLDRTIGTSVLKLSSAPPRQGDVVRFVNFQMNTAFSAPVQYPGVVGRGPKPLQEYNIVTGVVPTTPSDDVNKYRIMPGASGGLVANSKGELVAISFGYAGSRNKNGDVQRPTQRDISNELGLNVDNAILSGPFIAAAVPAAAIAGAMNR